MKGMFKQFFKNIFISSYVEHLSPFVVLMFEEIIFNYCFLLTPMLRFIHSLRLSSTHFDHDLKQK